MIELIRGLGSHCAAFVRRYELDVAEAETLCSAVSSLCEVQKSLGHLNGWCASHTGTRVQWTSAQALACHLSVGVERLVLNARALFLGVLEHKSEEVLAGLSRSMEGGAAWKNGDRVFSILRGTTWETRWDAGGLYATDFELGLYLTQDRSQFLEARDATAARRVTVESCLIPKESLGGDIATLVELAAELAGHVALLRQGARRVEVRWSSDSDGYKMAPQRHQ